MKYIVLDLEWNQPTSFQSSVYRRVGDKLLFEVIQIGAVKMDEQFAITDSVSIPVCPTYYLTIHPRIRRITGLTQDVLCDADNFPDAMRRFADWCGEDVVMLTWGGDDISVLKQNIDCFDLNYTLPKMYDLQRHYARITGRGGQASLKSAMDALEIAEDENRSFHNAMNDAYYTGQVFAKLGRPQELLQHEEHAKALRHAEPKTHFHATHRFSSVREALQSSILNEPLCPRCEHSMQLSTGIIPQAAGRYLALAKCSRHGTQFLKIRFIRLGENQVGMNLSIVPAGEQNKAYVRTKEYQYQFKNKRGDYDHFDPENLTMATGSNMPFEE